MNNLYELLNEAFRPLHLFSLKLALLLSYKPNNVHRWSWFTKNPWNKYGTKYCLFKEGTKQ